MRSLTDEAKTQQIYNLCHDLKTPLSTIMGMTTLAWDELEDKAKLKDHLSKIESASSYLLSMINDMLDYSKIVNGKMFLRHEEFYLDNMVAFLNQLLVPHVEKKHQNFHIKFTDVYQNRLIGDFIRTNQILTNLLTNSIKYTAVGGSIILEFIQLPKSHNSLLMEMVVSDTGIGMSEEFMKTMFESYSTDSGNRDCGRESTGLGLYITKNLVSLMGGEINVVSKPKVGTTIKVRIPFEIPQEKKSLNNVIDASSSREPSEPLASLHAMKNYDFRGKSILIAEDNPDMLEITTTMLKPSGIRILTSKNGLEALEFFQKSEPGAIDMILMDVRMPVMNGQEAAAAIRGLDHPDCKCVPIIALTASDDTEEEKKVRKAGVDEYVKKPVDYLNLYGIMDRYLNKNQVCKDLHHV
ncbi:MAG: response regulator [Clostridiales bacterium]|nr:response regulator [Clostridiales bacterium]